MDTRTGEIYSGSQIKDIQEKLNALEKSLENKPEKVASLQAKLDGVVPISDTVAEKMRLGNKAYKKKQKRIKMAERSRRRNRA